MVTLLVLVHVWVINCCHPSNPNHLPTPVLITSENGGTGIGTCYVMVKTVSFLNPTPNPDCNPDYLNIGGLELGLQYDQK